MDTKEQVLKLNGFDSLNPAQVVAYESGLLEQRSMVIAAPTASGKTLSAEIATLDMLNRGRKVVYIVPLKALASEKYQDFKEKYGPLGFRVAISMGDLDSSDSWLANYDLIIVTSEKMDSLLRHNISWAQEIGLVVADEIHLLNDPGRGPTLEMVLTRLRQICKPKILGLSATISNYQELAEWLEAEPVQSDYRPVKLYSGVYFENEINFNPKRELKLAIEEPITDIINHTLNKSKQLLMFVSTRRSAEAVAENTGKFIKNRLDHKSSADLKKVVQGILHLEQPTRQCLRLADCVRSGTAFHHAGLTSKQRAAIESAFRDGIIKIISATPTLAAGINMPAYRVIIRDLKRFNRGRGMDYIPVLEIQQMCLPGESKILMENGDYEKIEDIDNESESKIISLNKNGNCFESRRIHKKYERNVSELIKICTNTGKEMLATPEHPVLIWKDKPKWKKLDDITNNDRVGVVKKISIKKEQPFFIDYFDDEIYVINGYNVIRTLRKKTNMGYKDFCKILSIPYKTMKSYSYNKAIPLKHIIKLSDTYKIDKKYLLNLLRDCKYKTKYGSHFKAPKHIDEDFAWFLGLAFADGYIAKYHGHGKWKGTDYFKYKITSINEKIIFKLVNFCEKRELNFYIGKHKSGFNPEKESYQLEICNQAFIRVLMKFGIPSGKKSRTIRMKKIFLLPDNLIAGFIAGFYDGDGNVSLATPAIRLSSVNKELIEDCQSLFIRLGIRSTIHKDSISYCISISRKEDISNFSRKIPCVRLIVPELTLLSNTKPLKLDGDVEFEKIRSIERIIIKEPMTVYNLSIDENENYTCNNFIVHNCGRAGRPKYDTEGEAILIAKSKAEARYAWDRYIMGESEDISSKLGVEPVLRTHVLALVASGMVTSKQELYDFFSKTFYAHQYKDLSELNRKLDKILLMLQDFRFISMSDGGSPFTAASDLGGGDLAPTRIGKRVSELYIDPITANGFIKNLEAAERKGTNDFGYLHTICDTMEMMPLLGLRKNDFSALNELIVEEEKNLLRMPPSPWELEYDNYMRSLKTAMFFREWINETSEDQLLENFGVTPGELRVRLSNADWLLYSLQELGLLLNHKNLLNNIRKTRLRVKYGISEELITLIKLKGIGRVKARRMYAAGIKKISDISKVPKDSLKKVLGPKTAEQVLKQV